MTEDMSTTALDRPLLSGGSPAGSTRRDGSAARPGYLAWVPTWGLIATKHLELRKRRVLMVVSALLTVGFPVLVLGLRLLFHLIDPKTYGPAGSPSIFGGLTNTMAEFGFIIAASIGATVATSDLSDGMFRHLVITGRSRLALFLTRIPVGLSVVIPLVGLAFAMTCLVTTYEGQAQPTSVSVSGTSASVSVPPYLDQAQLESWITQHPRQAVQAFGNGPGAPSPAVRALVGQGLPTTYAEYLTAENQEFNPAVNEMVKIGLWLELDAGVGFIVGLGFASLIGQRTVPIVLLIVLQIIITPALAHVELPYFLDGERVIVGIALDQLRPAGLVSGVGGGGGPARTLFGGGGALGIPPMPTWGMITVIVGWIVGWSGIGAWRMATRDA